MSKIDVLAEQTSFLLEKQQEALLFFKKGFKTLYNELDAEQKKAEQAKAGSELESFQNVRTMLSDQEQETIDQCEEDVAFLEEQLAAIKQVQDMPDEKRAEEITAMMLDEDHELPDTKKFKTDVEQEAEEAYQSFQEMIDEITAILHEDGIKELETLLEAHALAANDEEEGQEEESSQRSVEECGSSCSSCKGCDIFEGLEIEIEDEPEEK